MDTACRYSRASLEYSITDLEHADDVVLFAADYEGMQK